LVMDSITGQGMGHALRDADLLSDAIISGLGGGRLDRALARYVKERDKQTKAMFDFTVRIASFPPPTPAEETMFAAIAERPEETSQLLGAIAGSVPITSLFSPRRLISLTGVRGFAALARSQLPPVTPGPAPVEALTDRVARPSRADAVQVSGSLSQEIAARFRGEPRALRRPTGGGSWLYRSIAAASTAQYVKIIDAPARRIAVSVSIITRSRSSQPFAAAASTIANSPLT